MPGVETCREYALSIPNSDCFDLRESCGMLFKFPPSSLPDSMIATAGLIQIESVLPIIAKSASYVFTVNICSIFIGHNSFLAGNGNAKKRHISFDYLRCAVSVMPMLSSHIGVGLESGFIFTENELNVENESAEAACRFTISWFASSINDFTPNLTTQSTSNYLSRLLATVTNTICEIQCYDIGD